MAEQMVEEMVCRLWWADPTTAWHRSLERFLDRDELARRGLFRRAQDADRFALGAVLLRAAVASATGVDPGQVSVDRSCHRCGVQHGRPLIEGGRPFVSVSHSGSVVVVAVCHLAPIGVDVEEVKDVDVHGLAASVLAADEPPPRDLQDFFVYWTRKEAFLKATGEGIVAGMDQVTVSPPAQPAAVLRHAGGRPAAGLIDVRLPVPGYSTAVSVLADARPSVDVRDGAALLAGGTRPAGRPPAPGGGTGQDPR